MNKIKIKYILLLLISSLTLTACGLSNAAQDSSFSADEQSTSAGQQTNFLYIDEAASTVELTISKDYMESATQEELDTAAEEMGFQSITLQDDGSVVYVMTIQQHEQMLADIRENIHAGLESMKESNDYKNFTDITANEDFTEFTITTTSERLDMAESFSVMTFYMYGEMYNMFNGTPSANIHVVFLNAETGEVVSAADSSNRKNENKGNP